MLRCRKGLEFMENTVIDDKDLARVLAVLGAGGTRSAAEVLRDAVKRFSRIVLRGTPPLIGGKKRKDHTEFLQRRIIGMRLPRGNARRLRPEDHMSKREARAYFRVAKARQGELLSGWNAAAQFSGLSVPGWIARHGTRHGALLYSESPSGERASVTFVDDSKNRRTNIDHLARRAVKRLEYGLQKQAEMMLRKMARGGGLR